MKSLLPRLGYAVLAAALTCQNRLEEAGQVWSELDQRFGIQISDDLARYLACLARDPEWGKVIERTILRAPEAMSRQRGE